MPLSPLFQVAWPGRNRVARLAFARLESTIRRNSVLDIWDRMAFVIVSCEDSYSLCRPVTVARWSLSRRAIVAASVITCTVLPLYIRYPHHISGFPPLRLRSGQAFRGNEKQKKAAARA